MNPDPVVVAIDLGGTTMKGALVDRRTRVLRSEVRPTRSNGATVEALAALVADLIDLAGTDQRVVEAIGVVCPGIIDEDAGIIRYAANLELRDVPLRDILVRETGLPVAVGHDGRAAGLAEGLHGAACGVANYVLVPIGTGISAAIICGGRSVVGAAFSAGEVGHIPVYPDGDRCSCGQIGCLEIYASAAGIERRYAAAGGAAGTGADAIGRSLGADPIAAKVWADATRALGLGLATLTLVVDPELIVIGGGLSGAGDTLLDPVRVALQGNLSWRKAPPLTVSGLGADAGRIGAATLALQAAQQAAQ